MDYIKHALTLFTDFIAVLVRILIITVSTQTTFAAYSFSIHCLPQFMVMLMWYDLIYCADDAVFHCSSRTQVTSQKKAGRRRGGGGGLEHFICT
jgi:hypothetical protein